MAPYSGGAVGGTASKCSVQISSIHPGSDFMKMNLQADSKTASTLARTISSAAAWFFSQFSFAWPTAFNDSPCRIVRSYMAVSFLWSGGAASRTLTARRWPPFHPHSNATLYSSVIVPADGTRAVTVGNGDFGTAFVGQLSDKPLLASICLCGMSGAKNNGG